MSEARWSPSRRTFVTYGAVSTGTLLGLSMASADSESDSIESDAGAVDYGGVRSDQFVPDSPVTVLESTLNWQPERFEDAHRTSVIASDHAPSYRAFLFTESDVTLESDQSLEFRVVRGTSESAGRRFVTVAFE